MSTDDGKAPGSIDGYEMDGTPLDADARLVAHLFGELAPDEARALEAELERDPERAELRARLAATAALVRAALPAEDLPPAVRATLLAAAARERATTRQGGGSAVLRLLPGRRARRTAAAIAAAAVALLLARPWLADAPAPEQVAMVDRQADVPEAERLRYELGRKALFGQPADTTLGEPDEDAAALAYRARTVTLGLPAANAAQASKDRAGLQPSTGFDPSSPQGGGGKFQVFALGGLDKGTPMQPFPPNRTTSRQDMYTWRDTAALPGVQDQLASGATSLGTPVAGLAGKELQKEGVLGEALRELGYSGGGGSTAPSTGTRGVRPSTSGHGLSVTDALSNGADARALERFYKESELGARLTATTATSGSAKAPAREKDVLQRLEDLGYTADDRKAEPPAEEPPAAAAPTDAPRDARGDVLRVPVVAGKAGQVVDGEVAAGRRPLETEGVDLLEVDESAAGGKRKEVQAPVRRVAPDPQKTADRLYDRIVQSLEPVEGERATQLFFRYWGDNPWVPVEESALSTFAADVDTGSYGVVRRILRAGALPRPEQVRTEEMLNWFRPDVAPPTDGSTFRAVLDAAPSRFDSDPDVVLLRVALRGREVDRTARKPLALTFVVDVSGSMKEHDRLPTVQHALKLLLRELSTTDSVALVAFGQEARTVVPMTSAANRGPIEDAIDLLTADGGTNVDAGLTAGYELAAGERTPGAVNRVVFLSDGVGTIGETDQARILEHVADQRAQGIYLSTLGIGFGVDEQEKYADDFLEQLADHGDGVYHDVNDQADAERYLVDQFTQTLEPIARDVKIQVELDPAQVVAWRQLGYENRALTTEQFRDDAVDAGEVHAGHQVTALYELRLRRGAAATQPLATARVRWKPPFAIDSGDTSDEGAKAAEHATEATWSLSAGSVAPSWDATAPGYRRAAVVAQLAEVLRRSEHARGDSVADLVDAMQALAPELADPDFDELLSLVRAMRAPLEKLSTSLGPVDDTVEAIRQRQVEVLQQRESLEQHQAGLDAAAREARQAEIERLRKEIAGLEGKLHELLAKELAASAKGER